MRAGIVVRVAGNGQEALDVLARERFDAVLMDCQMPVMDGFTATRALRQQPGLQALPVIAMTANAMAGDREAVLAAGMNDHIAKPIVVDAMFDTLARWVTPTHSAGAGDAGGPAQTLSAGNVIDSHCGVANMGGNGVLYQRMLGMFRERETNFVQRFHAARAAGDSEAAMRIAHDLKAVAGTLGMHALQEAAAVFGTRVPGRRTRRRGLGAQGVLPPRQGRRRNPGRREHANRVAGALRAVRQWVGSLRLDSEGERQSGVSEQARRRRPV